MKSLLITGLFAAFALAQPHNHNHHRRAHNHRAVHEPAHEKRGIHTYWVTETKWETKTEYVANTKTVYMGKPKATKDAQFHESSPKTTPSPKYEPPAPPAPAPAAAAPKVEQPAAAPPPPQAAPPAPAAPPPASYPAPSPPERNIAAPGGGGDYRSGQMTYYAVGLGACGWNDSGRGQSDYIVAMNAPLMGAQSNGNPMCGRKVEISYNGKTITAEVRDKCPECQPGDLDVSEAAFVALCGGTGAGRVNMSWKFV